MAARYITLEGNRLSAKSPRTLESFADDLPIEKLPDDVVFIFTNGTRQQLSELHLPIRVRNALARAAGSGRVIFMNTTEDAPKKNAAPRGDAAAGQANVSSATGAK